MSDWSTSGSKSSNKNKPRPREENKTIVSEHQIWLKNIDGLNEVDLEEIFADYDLVESFLIDQQPPFAFLTFRDPEVVQELLEQKSFYCDKNGKYLIMQPAKVKNQVEHERLLERIKKTKNIDQQQIVGVQLVGHSPEAVIDLSQKQVKFKVRIQNKTAIARTLSYVRMQGQRKFFKFEIPKRYDKTRIPPSGAVDIDIVFSHELDHPANCMQTLTIEVDKYRFPYHLIVNLSALDEVALLQKTGDYKQKAELEFPDRIIPAFPPERKSKTHFHTPAETFYSEDLGLYEVPDNIHQQVMDKDTYSGFNPWKFKDNWKQRLHELLYIEEVEQEKKSHRYDLRDVTIPQIPWEEGLTYGIDTRDILSEIFVPGLAENRPSVLFNDYVFAWPVGGTDYAYEGWVYKVKEKSILVMFHTDFHRTFKSDTLFNVRFRFNRMPMRLRHRAIDNLEMDLFWPASIPEHVSKKYSVETLRWTDTKIKANPEQSEAIVNMLNGTNGSAPYLIFGPFGTGKTRCLVEYTKQVLALQKECRILVCAQSNSGSDKITRELMSVLKPTEMFRLYAFNQKRIERDIVAYTRRDEENNIYIPPTREELKKYRVVVSTANNSATIFGLGVGRNHFTHIMIDEAAQMMEPEAAIPLCLASKNTKILLVGDNKQTGPRIFSRVAKHHGLDKSLMERLLTNDYYRGQTNRSVCMNLVRNYRSHPKIISFLSELFYDNKLLCFTNKEEYTSLERWNKRGTKQDFPFLFYALDNTKEDREEDSPSFFNIDEAITICSLVKNLLDQVRTISEEEVCVVTASHKQSVKIRQLMRKKDLRGVNVASTEEFQGREYKAIFMSTVRSSATYLDHDRQYNVGFIEDEKRFNTALSRAVALVVIVGNSKILARSPVWAKTIRYCSTNNSYLNFMHDPKVKDEEEEEDAQFLTTSNNNVSFPSLSGEDPSQNEDLVNEAMKWKAEEAIREAEEIKKEEQRLKEVEAKERARAAARAKKLELKTSSPEFRPGQLSGSASALPPPQALQPSATPSPLSKSGTLAPSTTPKNPLSASSELLQRVANPTNVVIPVQNPWNQSVLVQTPQPVQPLQPVAQQPFSNGIAGATLQPVGQILPQVPAQPSPQMVQMQQQLEHLQLLQQQQAAQFIPQLGGQMQPQLGQMQPQQQLQQPQINIQANGHDDESWSVAEKPKSLALSEFLGKTLIEAFKDKGLKGYPPFCVIEGQTELRICFTKFLLRDLAPQRTSDGKTMFVEFVSMIPPNIGGFNLLAAVPSIVPFSPSSTIAKVENNVLLSKIKINVPDYYTLSTWQSDDHSLFIFFRKQAMQYPMIFGNS